LNSGIGFLLFLVVVCFATVKSLVEKAVGAPVKRQAGWIIYEMMYINVSSMTRLNSSSLSCVVLLWWHRWVDCPREGRASRQAASNAAATAWVLLLCV